MYVNVFDGANVFDLHDGADDARLNLSPDQARELAEDLIAAAANAESDTDALWDEIDNACREGRPVMIHIRIGPEETSESSWEHSCFMLGDGAVGGHPRGDLLSHPPIRVAISDAASQRPSPSKDRPYQTCSDFKTLTQDGDNPAQVRRSTAWTP